MNKLKSWIVIVIIFLSIGLASAAQTYNVSSYSVLDSYSGGETIKGSINISFTEQPNKNITSSLGGSLSLLNFLNSSDVDFICTPDDCSNGYSASNGEESKSFILDDEKLFAFSIKDYYDVLTKTFEFNISGDRGSSCDNQIYVDLLNDGYVDFYNDGYVDVACSQKNYGCFNTSKTNFGTISLNNSNEYCEKIRLPPAPAYRLGAELRNDSSQIGNVTAKIYDLTTGALAGKCTLPKNNETGFQNLSCISNYSSFNEFDALVCVYGSSTNSGRTIKAETSSPRCGYSQPSSTSEADISDISSQSDFSVYAYPLQYNSAINLRFNDKKFAKMTLGGNSKLLDILNEYLDKKYGYNCSAGCVIPFLIGGSNQNVEITAANLIFDAGDIKNINAPDSQLVYSVRELPFTISMTPKVLDLSKLGFVAPNIDGTRELKLIIDGKTLVTKSVSILAGINFDINPKFVAVGREIEFTASGYGNSSATSEWNFGDNTTKTTSSNNKAIHVYQTSGEYEVTVKLNTGVRVSSKTFKVFVGNAKEAANLTIDEYQKSINSADAKAKTYPSWIQPIINKNLDLANLNISLMMIATQFSKATSDSEYEAVLRNLSTLDIPTLLYSSNKGSNLPLVIGANNIDLTYLAEIDKTEVAAGAEDKLKANIASWISENYDAKISFETVSKNVNKKEEAIVTYFKISLVRKTSNDQTYLIIGIPKGSALFAQEYSASEVGEGSGFYIPFDGNKEIEFAVLGKAEASSLGAYVSPPIYKLGVYENIGEYEQPGFNWFRFIVAMLILVLVVLAAYIFLQEWYKKNYEGLLFKNANDLYNLINFIYNSRSSGMKDDEIRKKLSKSGWNSEQISYAFKKISGKRTGMWEIPLFKFSENKKVKQEIMQRHPEGIDTRFINAQNL